MIDREQAIANVLMDEGWTCDMHEPDHRCEDCQNLYAGTAKAILALPDPVHKAARRAEARADRLLLRAERAEGALINLKAEYAFDCEVPIRELREELARLRPVHEAAREVLADWDTRYKPMAWQSQWDEMEALRAALDNLQVAHSFCNIRKGARV